jgi:hypothetical protein
MLAELHAPRLVAYALGSPDPGRRLLLEYIAFHAANGYPTYRNLSLWAILEQVIALPDAAYLREVLAALSTGALAGGSPEFTEAAAIALRARKASSDPAERARFVKDATDAAQAIDTLGPGRGSGDNLGVHKRRLGAYVEALSVALGAPEAETLIRRALGTPYGFAGFQSPACLTLADSIRISASALGRSDLDRARSEALNQARLATHNVSDPTLCARTTARCNAILERRWMARGGAPLDLAEVVDRFVEDPRAPEFAALHFVGWPYQGRNERPEDQPLPGWARGARSLEELAGLYDLPLDDFRRLNPEILDASAAPDDGLAVRVPDPAFSPLVAAHLSAELLVAGGPGAGEHRRRLQRLVPIVASHRTSLDAVLGRILLALDPTDTQAIAEAERILVTAAPG